MLSGKIRNRTSFIYCEDYEKGNLPNTLFTPKINKTRKTIKNGFEVIDYKTGEIIGDTKKVSSIFNIKEATLRAYLNGVCTNKTDFIYKKDYDLELKPTDLSNTVKQEVECMNIITGEVYSSIKEASIMLNTSVDILYKYLNDEIKHKKYPIVRLKDYNINFSYNKEDYNFKYFDKSSKIVIDTETKEEFTNLKDVSDKYKISIDMLHKILNFKCYNYYNLIYKIDYDKGLLPNSNYKGSGVNRKKEVINLFTGEVFKSIRCLAKHLNINNSKLSKSLKDGGYREYKLL